MMHAVANVERAAEIAGVWQIAERRVRREGDTGQVDLILTRETGKSSGKACRMVELQHAARSGEVTAAADDPLKSTKRPVADC